MSLIRVSSFLSLTTLYAFTPRLAIAQQAAPTPPAQAAKAAAAPTPPGAGPGSSAKDQPSEVVPAPSNPATPPAEQPSGSASDSQSSSPNNAPSADAVNATQGAAAGNTAAGNTASENTAAETTAVENTAVENTAVETSAEPRPDAPATQQDITDVRNDVQGVTSDLENFKFQWQREIDIHTATTTRGLRLGGTIQARFGWIDQAVNPPPANSPPLAAPAIYNRKTTFEVPTAIIRFSGSLYKDYAEGRNLDFALSFGGSPQANTNNSFANVLDANIVYSILPTIAAELPVLNITVGQQLLPFGLEVSAPEELKPVIRNAEFTLPSRLGLAARDIGVLVKGDLFPLVDYGYNFRVPVIAYFFGVYNGAGPNTQDNNNNKDILGRLAFTVPTEYNSWLRQLTIGATGYFGKQNTYVTTAEKTNILAGKGVKRRLGVDLYYNHWPFGVTFEYVRGTDVKATGQTLEDQKRSDVHSQAYTATFFFSFGQQFVAGFRNQGKYDDWWPKTFQPFVRYDRFDPNTKVNKDHVEIWTAGVNLFVAETTKFQVNYNRRDDKGNARGVSNEVLTQAQFGF